MFNNIMHADSLASSVSKPSAVMVFSIIIVNYIRDKFISSLEGSGGVTYLYKMKYEE